MSNRNAAQRGAFDEWVDAMREWQREISAVTDPNVVLTEKFADTLPPEIAYGRYAGERRWESMAEIPSGQIKDELLQLVVWQGDSEVRAVEQARELLERRATRGEALLEMFNVKLNWVDVFSWHNWGDRVGKYQLTMFAGCGFAPFARSIVYAGKAWDGPERLPTPADEAALQEIFRSPGWIAPLAAAA